MGFGENLWFYYFGILNVWGYKLRMPVSMKICFFRRDFQHICNRIKILYILQSDIIIIISFGQFYRDHLLHSGNFGSWANPFRFPTSISTEVFILLYITYIDKDRFGRKYPKQRKRERNASSSSSSLSSFWAFPFSWETAVMRLCFGGG